MVSFIPHNDDRHDQTLKSEPASARVKSSALKAITNLKTIIGDVNILKRKKSITTSFNHLSENLRIMRRNDNKIENFSGFEAEEKHIGTSATRSSATSSSSDYSSSDSEVEINENERDNDNENYDIFVPLSSSNIKISPDDFFASKVEDQRFASNRSSIAPPSSTSTTVPSQYDRFKIAKKAASLQQNPKKPTPKEIASVFSKVRHNRYDSVQSILRTRDFPQDSRDEHGNTLLIVACQQNLKKMVKMLLRYGFDVNATNWKRSAGIDYAKKLSYTDLYDTMKKYGGEETSVTDGDEEHEATG